MTNITLKLAEGVSLVIELDNVIWEGPIGELFDDGFSITALGILPETEVIVITKDLI